MGTFASRQVILLPFPYSDLSAQKLRPALILANADPTAVELKQEAFANGSLQRTSHARPSKLFAAHESLFGAVVGDLQDAVRQAVVETLIAVVKQG